MCSKNRQKLSQQSLSKTDRDLNHSFLLFQLMNSKETRKTKQNNKTLILAKLMKSILIEEVDGEGIEDLSRNVESPDDAAELISKIERVTKSKKNNILVLPYHQGKIFKKFKENSKFKCAVSKFKISNETISFKIGIIMFVDVTQR